MHWGRLLAMAEGAGVDRLLLDLTSNGGGDIEIGYWAAAALYPELLVPNNTYPWLGAYDRRVGPLAHYLQDKGLLVSGGPLQVTPSSTHVLHCSINVAYLYIDSVQ